MTYTDTESIKLPLKKYDKFVFKENVIHWTSSKPFVKNCSGLLIHRPKHVLTYNSRGGMWLIVGYWCGSSANGIEKLKFIDKPRDREPLCPKCEEMALKNGYPSADTLVGSSVYKNDTNGHYTMLYKSALADEIFRTKLEETHESKTSNQIARFCA